MMAGVFKSTDAGLAHTPDRGWGLSISGQYNIQVLHQTLELGHTVVATAS